MAFKRTIYLAIVCCSLIVNKVWAQENPETLQDEVQRLVEEIAEESDSELSPEILGELLMQKAENPFDLHTATIDKLEGLMFLSDAQIEHLLDYIDRYDPVLSYYELAYIPGFTQRDAQRLRLFTYLPGLARRAPNKRASSLLINRMTAGLPRASAYDDDKYEGSPVGFYTKFRFEDDSLAVGFTAEKDQGEAFFAKSNPTGFDYLSGYLRLNPWGGARTFILGDYIAQWGQGLVVWGGFATSKSGASAALRRKARGISPYSSTDENRFFRGMSYQYQHKRWLIALFGSRNAQDASEAVNSQGQTVLGSIQESGLHRTATEIANENRTSVSVLGGHAQWQSRRAGVGISALGYRYGNQFSDTEGLYRYWPQPQSGGNLSVDYNAQLHNGRFFGEAAVDAQGAVALLQGADFEINKHLEMSMLYRNYSPRYHAPFAAAFGETTGVANENGLYLGAIFRPVARWSVSAFADAFRFPWLRFGVDSPTNGYEYLLKIGYEPARKWSLWWRLKLEQKAENQSNIDHGTKPMQTKRWWWARTELRYQLTEALKVSQRIEVAAYDTTQTSWGWMAYLDMNYQPRQWPLRLAGRLAVSDTQYDTRIYAYESDLLYGFAVPAYIGSGMRAYLLAEYQATRHISVGARWAVNFQPSMTSLGSGYDETTGSSKHSFKLQCIVRW